MVLLALDMGLSSSIGVSMAARRSPSAISSFISSAILFSRIVKNSTIAEMTINTDATMNGISMAQILRAASSELM